MKESPWKISGTDLEAEVDKARSERNRLKEISEYYSHDLLMAIMDYLRSQEISSLPEIEKSDGTIIFNIFNRSNINADFTEKNHAEIDAILSKINNQIADFHYQLIYQEVSENPTEDGWGWKKGRRPLILKFKLVKND